MTNNTSLNDSRRSTSCRRTIAACVAGVAAAGLLATAASADEGTTLSRSTLQSALDDVVGAGAPGAVVLVRDGDDTIRLSSGLGNLAPETPMRIEDRARVGGITKSFTATVILQLVGDGAITLDETVERWLPGVIPNGADVTIRQLLNHTSGIYNYSSDATILAPYMEGNLTQPFDPRDGVTIAAGHEPLFAPGTSFSYGNTNYLLLAMIVEAATGNPFESELMSRIVEPLALDHTTYTTTPEIAGQHAHGYMMIPEPFDVTSWNPAMFGASGAILSNAVDVARFYEALLQGELLSRDGLEAMMTIDPVARGGIPDAGLLGGGWGLGLLREEFPCGVAWGHDSENPGYMTAAWSSADGQRQVVVIVTSNSGHDDPVSAAMRDLLVMGFCGA